MKTVLGFSGGVDSSVCAELLKAQGHEVLGLYLDIGGESAKRFAMETADFIGIPLKIANISDRLEALVCREFEAAYLKGETPNPCILCNPSVKFKALIDYADETGANMIATGHYARVENGHLLKGLPSNDQSYMLCRLTEKQLSRTLFPLGGFEKSQVRQMAADMKLPSANKPDSMEICFIPDNDYINWLSQRTGLPGPGNLIFRGVVVGQHKGICSYTVGQRYPGLFDGGKAYISRINATDNIIELARDEELYKSKLAARDFNWINGSPSEPVRAQVKVRHTKKEMPFCTARAEGGLVIIECESPVRAPAAGQSAVLYDGNRVLGGGFIIQN